MRLTTVLLPTGRWQHAQYMLRRSEASRRSGVLRLVLRTQPRSKKFAQAAKPFRSITTNEHDWDWRTERPVLLYAKANQRRESKSNRGSKLHQRDGSLPSWLSQPREGRRESPALPPALALAQTTMNTSKFYFDHEKLVAYQRSIQFIAWSSPLLENQSPKLAVFDQLDRASTSVPLNVAEGNAK